MASNEVGHSSRIQTDDSVIHCGPCLSEGNSIDAYQICENCCEYLCDTCVRYHKKFSATSGHMIVKKDEFSKTQDFDDRHLFDFDQPIEDVPDLHPTTREHKEKYASLILSHCGDLNVKTPDDTKNCYITGCTLLTSGYLVLTDYENRSVKVLDTKHHAVLSEVFLNDAPWDVTMVTFHKLVVTLPSAQLIQYFTVDFGVLSKGECLVENGECRGIAHYDGHLVVSYDKPSKIQILSLDGHVLKSFKQDANGIHMFLCPHYVAISPDGKFIYISDRDTFTITKITFEGEIVASYEDRELCSPRGIVAKGDGTLIICNWRNNKLHLISSACEKVQILQPVSDDVLCPSAVCFCEDLNKLYVSRHWVGAHPNYINNIKVLEFE